MVVVTRFDDAEKVLADAGAFLASAPVENGLILALLAQRVAYPEPGQYWVARDDRSGAVYGVAFRSPVGFRVTLTPMAPAVVRAVVDAIADDDVELPGASGEAATAAAFAGHWAERRRAPVRPVDGQRLYEISELTMPTGVPGAMRGASVDDQDLLVEWVGDFEVEIGERRSSDLDEFVERRLADFRVWCDDGAPVCIAAVTNPQAGVVRIGPVFTPPDRRGHGYAAALVGSMSRDALAAGNRCTLYTDLTNPTSNAIYQRLGYRVVSEQLRYEFDAPR